VFGAVNFFLFSFISPHDVDGALPPTTPIHPFCFAMAFSAKILEDPMVFCFASLCISYFRFRNHVIPRTRPQHDLRLVCFVSLSFCSSYTSDVSRRRGAGAPTRSEEHGLGQWPMMMTTLSTRTWMGARLQTPELVMRHAKVAMMDVSFFFVVLFSSFFLSWHALMTTRNRHCVDLA
jgi:hypothetical protein